MKNSVLLPVFLFVTCTLISFIILAHCEDVSKHHGSARDDDKQSSGSSASALLSKKLGDENVVVSLVKGLVQFASNGFKCKSTIIPFFCCCLTKSLIILLWFITSRF